jgi:hypothetical protein
LGFSFVESRGSWININSAGKGYTISALVQQPKTMHKRHSKRTTLDRNSSPWFAYDLDTY